MPCLLMTRAQKAFPIMLPHPVVHKKDANFAISCFHYFDIMCRNAVSVPTRQVAYVSSRPSCLICLPLSLLSHFFLPSFLTSFLTPSFPPLSLSLSFSLSPSLPFFPSFLPSSLPSFPLFLLHYFPPSLFFFLLHFLPRNVKCTYNFMVINILQGMSWRACSASRKTRRKPTEARKISIPPS